MKLHLPIALLTTLVAVLASSAQAETDRIYKGNNNTKINTSGYTNEVVFQMSGGGTNNYFSSAQNTTCTTVAAIVIQDDAGTTDAVEGLIITNGHTNDVQIFTGALSGNGLLQKTGDGNPNTIVFEGDASAFTGTIDLSSDRTFTLVFGGNSDAVTAAESSANEGIIGNGNITFNSVDKNGDSSLLQTLRFNYAASGNNPVYITNSIKDTGKGTSKLELTGGASYQFTEEVVVDHLSISSGSTAHFGANLSIGTLSGNSLTLANGCSLTVGRTDGTIAADITGGISLIKDCTTTTTLSGNNSFTGGTTVKAGTLIADSASALSGDITVDAGATLQFNDKPTEACTITLNGTLNMNWATAQYVSNQLSVENATAFYTSASSDTAAADGYARWINPVIFDGNIYLGETGSIGTANLNVNEDNKLVYVGTFNKTDTFYVNSSDFQITTDISASTFRVAGGASLDINGHALADKSIQLESGATLTNTGNDVGLGLQQIQNITLNGDATVSAVNGKEFGILGYRWGATSMVLNGNTLTKNGEGTFFLVNTTVSGGGKIQVNAGTLQTGHYHSYSGIVNAYADSTEFAVAEGAKLLLADNSSLSAAGISGSGSITKTGGSITTLTLAGSGEYTFSGSISDQIAVNKIGSGHQLLTGSNTIRSLTMSAGTLTLGSEGAKITISTGTVTNGGTVHLAGDFTISGTLSDYEFASSAGVEYSVAGTLNGFKTTSGDSYYLFKGGNGSVAEGMSPASIDMSADSQLSDSATLSATEGGIVFTFGGSNTTNDFYVQQGIVSQSELLRNTSYGVTADTGYIVTSGGTLELAQSNRGVIQLNGGTLQLGSNMQQSDMNLTIQSGAVELNGKQLTLSTGDQTALLQSLTGTGTLVVSGDTTLMGSTSSASPISLSTTATLVITSGGRFNLGTDSGSQANLYASLGAISNVQLQGGTLRYNTGSSTINRLETVSGYTGSRFYIQDTNNVNDTVTISELHLNSDLSIDSEWDAKVEIKSLTGSGNLSLSGRNTSEDRTDTEAHDIKTTVSAGYTGTISLADENTLHAGFTLAEQATATIQAETDRNITKTQLDITLRDNSRLNISATSGKTVELDTVTVAEEAAANLSAAEGVLLSVREISGGSLTIGTEGGSTTLTGGTISNSGSLTLCGDITISGELDSYESYGSGNVIGYSMNDGTTNGFKLVAGMQYYLSKGGSNSLATHKAALNLTSSESLTGDTAYLSVADATEEKEAGIIFSLNPTHSVRFYVQEGTLNQGELLSNADYGVTTDTGYIVTSGGTLKLTQSSRGSVQLDGGTLVFTNEQSTDMADGAIQVNDSASSLQLAEGVALNYAKLSATEGAAALLTGSGTLLVDNREVGDSLSSVDMTSTEWSGILHLKNITTEDDGGVNLDSIAGNSSLLVLENVSGLLSCEDQTSEATLEHQTNLKLQGDGLQLNDGFSHITHRFTGEISGNGKLVMSGSPSHTLIFDGTTADWTGNISLDSGKENFITFSGTSEINNESISAARGTLNLNISTPGQVTVKSTLSDESRGNIRLTVSGSDAVFSGSVDISSLTVETGTNTAMTSSEISVDSVDNAGSLSFTGIQALSLTDLTAADGSVLSVGSGVALLADDAVSGPGSVDVSGTAVLEGGSTINGSLDLSGADSIELNNMDEAINVNGDLILVLGETPTLSGNYTEMLENLMDGQSLDIFHVTGSITLNGQELSDGYREDAGSVIASMEQGLYSLGYRASDTGNGGTLYLSTASSPAVPEPTTATLSLLALAALASRRRRK